MVRWLWKGPLLLDRADVIVVMGASVLPNGEPSRALKRRVLAGVKAFNEGRGSYFIVSGGPLKHATPEAVVMANIARENGVSDDVLLVEPEARNTFENAQFSGELMQAAGLKRALIVSDAWHLERALWCFSHYEIEAEGYSVPVDLHPDPAWRRMINRFRETAAREKYRWLLAFKRVQPLK